MNNKTSKKKVVIIAGVVCFAVVISTVLGCEKRPESFADNNIVAKFSGGVITTDQLTTYINKIGPKCHTPMMGCHGGAATSGCATDSTCDIHDSQMGQMQDVSAQQSGAGDCCGGQHGGEHAGCCGGSQSELSNQPCGEHENCCMQHYDLKEEDYRNLVNAMVMEQMLRDYIRENKIGQERDTQNLIKYVSENVYITDTHLEMEENMRPAELDIRTFYEEHKEEFGLKTINEVRGEITSILKNKMHKEYMPRYLKELKRNALIRKNLELLQPTEPSEYELRSYYREHRNDYEEDEMIKIHQIQTHTREQAEQAQNQLRAGVDFAKVAEAYSKEDCADCGKAEVSSSIKRGDRSENFEQNVFRLREGDTSMLFEDNGNFYIVRVMEKRERRSKQFEEVTDSIREAVMREKEEHLFEENAQRTLFTVNNQSYSVEDFKKQYDRLPPHSQVRFSGFSGMENLMDRMIEYQLLADDASHKMFDLKNKETVQEITNSILQGTLYEKEVIGKINIEDISDEEANEYYENNRESFVNPPRAKISYIRIPISSSEEPGTMPLKSEIKAAQNRAEEAYTLLKNGAEFDVIAPQYSVDEWSSRQLDLYEEKGMPLASPGEEQLHPIHKVVFGMEEGEISEPYLYEDNYFIFKLWEKKEKWYVAFDDVKEAIKQVLVIQTRKERAEELQNELITKSQLVLNDQVLEMMAQGEKKKKPKKEETHVGHSG
jgi:parvulin-like peptidyl-prolyl isomerase